MDTVWKTKPAHTHTDTQRHTHTQFFKFSVIIFVLQRKIATENIMHVYTDNRGQKAEPQP